MSVRNSTTTTATSIPAACTFLNTTLSAVNDAPVVIAPGSALAATEQVGLAIHGTGFGVTDVDEAGGGATATLNVGEGVLNIVVGDSGVTVDSGDGTGNVTISGTIAQIDNLLTGTGTGTITYLNGSDTPSASTTLTVTVNDGGNTGVDPGLTGDATSEEGTNSQIINITAVNDAPTFSTTNSTPTFTENAGAVSLFSGTSIDTVESGDLIDTLVVTVASLADGSDEILVVDGQAIELTHLNSETTGGGYDVDVTLSGNTATVSITKTGGYTAAEAETLVDGLAYNNTSENPQGAVRLVTLFSVKDDGGTANGGADTTGIAIASLVTVNAVNDEESLDTNAILNLNEGATGVITNALLATSDVDNTAAQIVYTVDATPANGTLSLNWVTLSATDTFTQADVDAGLIRYRHDGGETTTDSFDFTVDDSSGHDHQRHVQFHDQPGQRRAGEHADGPATNGGEFGNRRCDRCSRCRSRWRRRCRSGCNLMGRRPRHLVSERRHRQLH